MTRLKRIEKEVAGLSPKELINFRKWFQSYDSALWEQQLDHDANAGKFDKLRDEALVEHDAKQTKEL